MARASVSLDVPGRASDAEGLWYDLTRRAAWMDGFGHVVEAPDGWPAAGRLVWMSRPGGRGRVLEQVVAYEPRTGQTLEVEDERLRGTQRVAFAPAADHVTVTLELAYELKEGPPLRAAHDWLFVRPQVAASLRRSLEQFVRERRSELEWDPADSR